MVEERLQRLGIHVLLCSYYCGYLSSNDSSRDVSSRSKFSFLAGDVAQGRRKFISFLTTVKDHLSAIQMGNVFILLCWNVPSDAASLIWLFRLNLHNVKVWHATLVTWLMCERAAQERCHHRLVRLVISSFGTSAATVGKSMPLLIEIGLPPAQGIAPSPIEYGILQSDPTKSYKITPRMQHAR